MENESIPSAKARTSWQPKQVYVMAAVCLLLGLAIGYLFRGSEAASTPEKLSDDRAQSAPAAGAATAQPPLPTLEQMKHMAETKAEPLLQQLKAKPNDAALLIQIGDIYKSAHQFKEAAGYYEKSLQIDPKNAGVRSDMATCFYYSGEVDKSIAQLEKSLQYDPKNAGALFNLGMVKWKGKMDAEGAVAAWQKLLKLHPELGNKAGVEQLIAQAREHPRLK
jgi:cytochrome c-type biogenesis protein CcmH/NrfG